MLLITTGKARGSVKANFQTSYGKCLRSRDFVCINIRC